MVARMVVLNVWEHTLLPPAGSVSVSGRYVPDPSQRTTEDLLQVIKEELGEDPPVLRLPPRSRPWPRPSQMDRPTKLRKLVMNGWPPSACGSVPLIVGQPTKSTRKRGAGRSMLTNTPAWTTHRLTNSHPGNLRPHNVERAPQVPG